MYNYDVNNCNPFLKGMQRMDLSKLADVWVNKHRVAAQLGLNRASSRLLALLAFALAHLQP